MTLGVQLPITGDDNFNATVTVRYRPSGTSAWKTGLPLYRVHTDVIYQYTTFPQFSGSIFDLRPNTTYDVELHATDPDGLDQILSLTATTRAVPGDPASPRNIQVSGAAQLQSALSSAQAGDIITLAAGSYPGNFVINASGTATNPIVIRGSSQSGVVIDGQNCTGCNVIEVYGSYTHVENMTLANAERALRFQSSGSIGNVARNLHITNTTMGIAGRATQYDFYIADNILEGRLQWPLIYTSDGGAHSDDTGIQVIGYGMVIAHNRISGYGDAMVNAQWGARSLDVYGNDVLWSYDNAIELDESEGNARAMRNRFTNTNAPISVQPVFDGPAYIFRNVVANAVDEQVKFHGLAIGTPAAQPNGVFVYHNTFLSSQNELQVQSGWGSHHFALENNLFIGPSILPSYPVNWDAPIDDGTFDYNGYFPDGHFLFHWASGYADYPNFANMQASGVEAHGVLLGQAIFANGLTAPTNYSVLMGPPDATLSSTGGAADRGLILPNINDGFTGTAPDLGALEIGCAAPIYGPRPAGTDESNEPLGCSGGATVAPPPPAPAPGTAAFVKTDTTTQGSWKSAYGSEGANVMGDGVTYPSYVTVTPAANFSYVWNASTSDPRATMRVSSNQRLAACWVSSSTFYIDLNFNDGQTHQVALYLLDWDNYFSRTQTVDILNSSGTVLDSHPVAQFTGGQYLVWNLGGHVIIRVTNTNPLSNAVVSGLFFGQGVAPQVTGAASFVRTDTTTQGSWKSAYGAEGANVIGDSAVYPSYVNVTPAANFSYTWNASTSDPRATMRLWSNQRLASCWVSPSVFTIDLNFTDGQQHQVALYLLDWDNFYSRTETIDVIDANGTVLDSRPVSQFTGGQYLVWKLSGHVILRVTNTNSLSNAVVSGLFFGGPTAATATDAASFVRTDTTTQGSWRSVYGADGANVIGDTAAYPSYVTVTPAANFFYVWAASTTDPRATSLLSSTTGRIAACWVTPTTFTIDLNFNDGRAHQVALYLLDWDFFHARTETIDVLSSTGAVLDSRPVSFFQGGQYLVWNLSGHVTLRVTNTNLLSNAVVSGLFFAPAI